MSEFNFLGQKVSFSAPRINYINIKKMYNDIAIKANDAFYKIYKSYGSIEQLIKNCEDKVHNEIFVKMIIPSTFSYIHAQEIYSVNEQSLYNTCYPYFKESFMEQFYLTITCDYEEIMDEKNDAADYRKERKAGRSKAVGYGFGLSGQLKASAKAGAVNMATGLGHSMVNAMGNAASSIAAAAKTTALFHNKENMEYLADCVTDVIRKVMNKTIAIVEANTNIRYEEPSESQINEAKTIGNNVYNGVIPKDKIPYFLAQVLAVIPDAEWIYEFAIERYGDENQEIEKMAKAFGIDTFKIKKRILDSKCSDLAASMTYDEEQVLAVKEKIAEVCKYFGYSNAALYLQAANKRLREIDIKLRTVEGVEYKTREIAKDVSEDFKTFNTKLNEFNFNEFNLLDEAVVSELYDIFTALEYKYRGFSRIASDKLSQILEPIKRKQELKSNLLNSEQFCETLYQFVFSQKLYKSISKQIYTIEFKNNKSNKIQNLDKSCGIPVLYHKFSTLGAFKKGLILTTRSIVMYNDKNNIQSIPFKDIKTIKIQDSTVNIKADLTSINFKKPSSIPNNILGEYAGLLKYLSDIFAEFSNEDIESIEKSLPVTIDLQAITENLPVQNSVDYTIEEEKKNELTTITDEVLPQNMIYTNKSQSIAIVLSLFFGCLGIDRFYLGYIGLGIVKFLTWGLFGILGLVDLIRICTGHLKPKKGLYKKK